MSDLSRKTASIYIDSAPAELALQRLQLQGNKLTESITKGQAAGKNMVAELAKLDKVNTQIASVQKQIDGGLRPSFNQLQTAVSKANAELRKLSEDDPGYAKKVEQVKGLKEELGRLSGQLVTVKEHSEAFGGSFGKIFERVAEYTSAYAILEGIKGLFEGIFEAGLKADTATTRFKGTLDNLGRSDAFERLNKKAEELHDRFNTFGKTEIIGVFEQLATFGKLTEQQMNELLPVIINFASKSGQSLKESTELFLSAIEGRAGPLRQLGIVIKDAKTEAERFGLVMETVGKKVNGAADAFGETTQGKIQATKVRFEELEESLGQKLLPSVNGVLNAFNRLITRITNPDIDLSIFTKAFDKLKSLESGPDKLSPGERLQANFNKYLARKNGGQEVAVGTPGALSFVQPEDTIPGSDKAFDGGKGLSTKSAEDIKKEQEARKKELEDLAKLKKEYQELEDKLYDHGDPLLENIRKINDEAKAEAEILKKALDSKLISEQKFSDESFQIQEQRLEKLTELLKKFNVNQVKVLNDIFDEVKSGQFSKTFFKTADIEPALKTDTPVSGPNVSKIDKDLQASDAAKFKDLLAGAELLDITSTGKKKIDAEKKVLDIQEAQELAAKDLTENEKALIEEKYRQKRAELDKNAIDTTTGKILESAQILSNFLSDVFATEQASDQQRQKNADAAASLQKTKLDRELGQKILSQKEYDRQIKALDDKKQKENHDLAVKEFKRNQTTAVLNAIIAGAEAIVDAQKLLPPLDTIKTIEAAAVTALQIGIIEKQKPPSLGKGGVLHGPLHSEGGMPVINPATGRKVAEVEGGEPFLSRKTYANNQEIVNQLLHSSMYGNGQRITPYWQTRSYLPLNYNAVSRTMENMKRYERGGVFANDTTSTTTINNNQIPKVDDKLINTLTNIERYLQQPGKSYVVLSDLNAQQEIMNKIIQDTTIRRNN